MLRNLSRTLRISLLIFALFLAVAGSFNADPNWVLKVFNTYMLWAGGIATVFVVGTLIGWVSKRDESRP